MNETTKKIIFSDKTESHLTFEEVRERFYPMVLKEMRQANSRFLYNPVEEDDFMQIMELELWRAYEQYDPEQGYCFTTYLYPKLQKGIRNATYSKYAQKNQAKTVSMSAPHGENDLKLEDLLLVEDTNSDSLSHDELYSLISENIEGEEIDALNALINKDEFSVQDFADKYSITRQAANQRVLKLKRKLRKIISTRYLESA